MLPDDQLIQLSISPVILISGVGLLLLTLTNRFGRLVDRARLLEREIQDADTPRRTRIQQQIDILYRRSRLLRASITFAAGCILCVSLLVIIIFVSGVWGVSAGLVVVGLFALAMVGLVVSMITFIGDMSLSLRALQLDLQGGESGSA